LQTTTKETGSKIKICKYNKKWGAWFKQKLKHILI
jgi:hypothetical protein